MSLLTRITVPPPDAPEAEDIFSSALTTIFTDDAINSWGSPGASIQYRSPRYGTITLKVPIHPDEEQGRKLFAHYLWNAGVVAAHAIEAASSPDGEASGDRGLEDTAAVEEGEEGKWDPCYWNVRGQRVLEIGAATALPSLIAALSDAAAVTITDHPSSPALTAGAIEQNVRDNLHYHAPPSPTDPNFIASTPRTQSNVAVYGYTWGTPTFYSPSGYGVPAPPPDPASLPAGTPLTEKGYPRPHKIIVADCLWMPSQHANIVKTIHDFLPEEDNGDGTTGGGGEKFTPSALVVAGFHTGRAIVRDFFALAVGREDPNDTDSGNDGKEASNAPPPPISAQPEPDPTAQSQKQSLTLAQIFETDMEGRRRPWTWERTREGETKWDAKRWCVVGVLVRR